MKIYTRKGDDGTTSLADGKRVLKNNIRVELYGSLDELGAYIGTALAFIPSDAANEFRKQRDHLVLGLTNVQSVLFELGARLAGYTKKEINIQTHILFLETSIDEMEKELTPLKNFLLSGGSASAAHLHTARAFARRVERNMIDVQTKKTTQDKEEILNRDTLTYMNRLSDYLFVAARTANRLCGIEDTLWKG